MKKYLFFAIAFVFAVANVNCSSTKVSKTIAKGDVEIDIPLNDPEHHSDKKYWRSVQIGTSTDVSMAKKVALQNARQDLAATVQSQIKAVMENYGQNASMEARTQNEALYQELATTVINQTLVGAELKDERLFKTADGNYRYHVCLQVSKDEMADQIIEKLSEEELLKLEFDRERFKKIYDEEMAKFIENNK